MYPCYRLTCIEANRLMRGRAKFIFGITDDAYLGSL